MACSHISHIPKDWDGDLEGLGHSRFHVYFLTRSQIPDPSVQGFTETGFHASRSTITLLPPTGTTWYSALVLPKPVTKEDKCIVCP